MCTALGIATLDSGQAKGRFWAWIRAAKQGEYMSVEWLVIAAAPVTASINDSLHQQLNAAGAAYVQTRARTRLNKPSHVITASARAAHAAIGFLLPSASKLHKGCCAVGHARAAAQGLRNNLASAQLACWKRRALQAVASYAQVQSVASRGVGPPLENPDSKKQIDS